jgi:NADH-quinone oxidoreductase subunit M
MNPLAVPWLELSLLVLLVGAASAMGIRDSRFASRWCVGFTTAAFGCVMLAWAGYSLGQTTTVVGRGWGEWAGRPLFVVDDVNAPLLPIVALIHVLVALTTARTKMHRFSFSRLMAEGAVRISAFACVDHWPFAVLLTLEAILPLIDYRRRGRSGQLYAIHAGLFVTLLGVGLAISKGTGWTGLGTVLLLLAVLVRTGVFPTHVWVTDLFERGTFGTALGFVTPLLGVTAAVRLALPVAPEWALEGFGIIALGTALYTAGMGIVQTNGRQFFAYLFISLASLVLVGVGLHTPFALTGSFVLWPSAALALTGLGTSLRAVELRVGSLDLSQYRGLYDHMPALAICFLLTGLTAVGFPGTTGFIAIELLVDEAVGAHVAVGIAVVLVMALNGIGVVRAYLLLFTGRRHVTGVSLALTIRERIAVLTLAVLILTGGLFPQLYLEDRHRAAERILTLRPESLLPVTAHQTHAR